MVHYFSLPINQPYKSAQAAYTPAEQSQESFPSCLSFLSQGTPSIAAIAETFIKFIIGHMMN